MLKPLFASKYNAPAAQSPLGGCVLKRVVQCRNRRGLHPVAFRRLCVETLTGVKYFVDIAQSPLGGCVLKLPYFHDCLVMHFQSPLGGCVLKLHPNLRAGRSPTQSPLGGCVL